MTTTTRFRPTWVPLLVLACATAAATGCSRARYRLQADRQAYDVIAERNVDPRWRVADYRVEMDRRSRYFDPYDPDHSPMPADDPTSHQYMHYVDGMQGWKHWHDNGQRIGLENPAWREALGQYVELGEDGAVKLNLDSALKLAYLHSPAHQSQLETLYLSSLDVTAERFRLDRQFFGGYDTRYAHRGSSIPATLRAGPIRGGGGTRLTVFSGQGGLGGYLGLLEQLQEVRNTEDNLNLQLRLLAQFEALLDVGVINLVQVDQFRQNVENERSRLLQLRNAFQLALDRYKTGTLGLPPDLPIELDDSLIRQFQLVAREATAIQDSIAELQDRVGKLPDDAGVEEIRQVLTDVFKLIEPVRRQLADAQADLARMDQALPERERSMADAEKEQFEHDREQLGETLADLNVRFDKAAAELEGLRDGLTDQTRDATTCKLVVWLSQLLRLVQRSILVQARARLEAVSVEAIQLDSQQALRIALANRMDFMNGRAALVDRWRRIQFDADALQSVVNVTASGDIRTARNNPVSFRAPTGSMRLGLEFDAPLTRLLERNDYRESLIDYQRSRRDFIQSRDALHLGLRELLRQIDLLGENLEIQRRAVVIAIRRVDMTRAALYAPVPPPRPGQRAAQFGPTAARDLLNALSALLDTQNSFMSVWLNYYAAKMRLARELGTMKLDEEGRWIESPLPGSRGGESVDGDDSNTEELPPPPPIPADWAELVRFLPRDPNGRHPVVHVSDTN